MAEKILSEMQASEEGAQEQALTIRLLVADQRMGTLIGRGGSVIKSIQEHSNARVSASEEVLPLSTERTMTIIGTPAAVHLAIQQIAEILAEYPERANHNSGMQYQPQPQHRMSSMSNMTPGMRNSYPAMSRSGGGSSPAAANAAMNPYQNMMGHMGGMPMGGMNPQQFYYQAAAAAAAAGAYGSPPAASGRQGEYGMAGMVATPQAQQIFIPNEMVGSS